MHYTTPVCRKVPAAVAHGQRRSRFVIVAAAGVGLGSIASTASGVDVSWIATGTADFNSAANWNPTQVPTASDNAIFANSATGTVGFSADAQVTDLVFRNTSGTLGVDTTGRQLTFVRFLIGNVTGSVNDVIFSGGTFQHNSTGQLFVIGGAAGSDGNKLTITGSGVRVLSTATGTGSSLGIAGSNNNELHVTNNAFVDIRNNITVGIIGATPSTGNLINVNNATLQITNGNRGINLRQGTLTVNNALMDFGGFLDADDAGNTAVINLNSGTFYSRATRVANGQPFRIGDGGVTPAVYGMTYSGPTLTAADGIVINSNGRLTGVGTITGNVSGVAGATVRPMIINNPTLTTDDRNFGTMTVNGNWDNSNIAITLAADDFPTALAGTTTPPFNPPVNGINISGAFTHGGSVTIDLAEYVAPQDMTYDLRLLGFGSQVGAPASTPVSFVNGSPLTFDWRSDGLYVQFQQVLGASRWNVDGGGDWTNAANWQGPVPNAADAVAHFGTIITSAANVNLDAPITVGGIEFASPIGYTLTSATNPLTFDVNAGTTATVSVTAGSHAITAPVVLADNTSVDAFAGAGVAMTGGVTGATATLTKAGEGNLTLGATNVGGLNASRGVTQLQANGTVTGTAVVKSLAVDAPGGARLDVTNNAMVVDYDATDPSADVRADLVSGYAGGAWNGAGINSSIAAATPGRSVGYALASEIPPAAIFGTVDNTAVLIRYTVAGDANLDGIANIGDFSRLASSFNQSGEWVDGDFNYDGTVNIGDFSLLASNFNTALPTGAGARGGAVPEPASLSLLAVAAAAATRRRRRQ